MVKSQVILGSILIVIGIALAFIHSIGIFYGVILSLIGIFLIIFRNAEDKIEKIKEDKKK